LCCDDTEYLNQRDSHFFKANKGGVERKGDLSPFAKEAVRTYQLENAVEQAKISSSSTAELVLTDQIE